MEMAGRTRDILECPTHQASWCHRHGVVEPT